MTTKKATKPDGGVENALQTKSLCLAVSFSKWGTKRKVDITPDAETKADKKLLSTRKRLLEAKEVRAINTADHDLKAWLARRCVSFPLQRSVYLVPVPLLAEVQAKLAAAEEKRAALVESLVAAMPALKKVAATRLADLYDDDEYPMGDDLRALYSINHAYVSFDVPGVLKELDSSIFADEKRRAQLRWKEASDEIQAAMREAFAQLVRGLTEKLAPSPDGKRRVIRDSAVENLREFIDGFSNRNLTDDRDLAKLVEQARKIVSGVDPDQLRKSDPTRERVAADMKKVVDRLDEMVVARPKRRFVEED